MKTPRPARKRARASSAAHESDGGRDPSGRKHERERGDPAMDAALAMLARCSQPSARIRERITQRFGADAADRIIARLFELRLLDDAAFAERFARDRFARAGYGRERIRADLRARGIALPHIQQAIASVIDEGSERERALGALERFRARSRRGRSGDLNGARRARDAEFRHLAGRGFPLELVAELLKATPADVREE